MKIIYYSYSSTFAAYMAACLHIGVYNPYKLPDDAVIAAHFNICVKYSESYGNMYYIGLDEALNEVYCMGCKKYHDLVKRFLDNTKKIFGIEEKLHYINTGSLDKTFTSIFNKLYIIFGANNVLGWFFKVWFRNVFQDCINLVEKEKKDLKSI